MLGDRLHRAARPDMQPEIDCWFEIRNQGLHAVHPLGWMRKFTVTVDSTTVPAEQVFFVLRGQWIRSDHLSGITDIFWHICEPAQVYVRLEGGINAGAHNVSCTIATSYLDQTVSLDVHGRWPLREQTVRRDMLLEEV